MKSYSFQSKDYQRLELTAQKTGGRCGSVKLLSAGLLCGEFYFKYEGFETTRLSIRAGTVYEIQLDQVEVSLACLCGQNDILDTGVCYLEFGDTLRCYASGNMGSAYSQSMRNRFHFAPFKNWMNDPNGLCFFQGRFHMFYQYNPNAPVWGNMHWGHAVSRDLVHWTNLPVALYPQIELLNSPEYRGGAFSGSAVASGDEMRLFFTRHYGRNDRSWQRQWQMTCSSRDGVRFTPEECLLWGTPEGVFFDFRDPKVSFAAGRWRMVLGGTHDDKPAVLLYSSDDLCHWEYGGVLLKEENPDYAIAECPDLFELDGKTVLTVGFISRFEMPGRPCGVRRDTRYYIGSFENETFFPESSGLLDEGKDFYAAQSFEHHGRRIVIGWNNDVPDTYIHEENSSNGTMSIPRELHIRNGLLYGYPIAEFSALDGECLLQVRGGSGFTCDRHRENCYKLELAFDCPSDFEILLTRNKECAVTLSCRADTLTLRCGDGDACSFAANTLRHLLVYVDRSLVEIFVNGGETACSRRYYLKNPVMELCARFQEENALNSACVTALRSIW